MVRAVEGWDFAVADGYGISRIQAKYLISLKEINCSQGTLQGGTLAGAKASRRFITASIPKSY